MSAILIPGSRLCRFSLLQSQGGRTAKIESQIMSVRHLFLKRFVLAHRHDACVVFGSSNVDCAVSHVSERVFDEAQKVEVIVGQLGRCTPSSFP